MTLNRDQAIATLWSRGNLSFKYHDGQKVVEDAFQKVQNKLFVCNISRRFGKTYWAITKAIECALKKKAARIIIASAFQTDVEEFIVPLFNEVLTDCPEKIRPLFKSSKKKYSFKNGSEISIVGLDKNPNAGRGRYVDLYIFEEAGFISESQMEYVYSSVVIPMTMYRENAKVIMISTPPKSPSHPFKTFCDRAQSENAYVRLTIFDNPMVDEGMREEYHRECLSESDWQREYMAEFVVDTNSAVIPEWDDKYERSAEQDKFYPYWHKYDAMDLGVVDLTACIFGYYNFMTSQLVVEDEVEINGPQMTTPVLADLIRNKETELWVNQKVYRRISDNNNLHLLQDLGSLHGLHFMPTNKESLEAMINEVRVMVKQGRILVHPRCVKLIGCLKYGVFQGADRKSFARSKVYGHFDHLACLIYLVRNIDQYSNPVPNDYGMTTNSHFMEKNLKESSNAKSFKKLFKVK